MYALAETDERDLARDLFEIEGGLVEQRAGQTVIAHKGSASVEFLTVLAEHDARLLRPAFKNEGPDAALGSLDGYARSSSRSMTPSKANSNTSIVVTRSANSVVVCVL